MSEFRLIMYLTYLIFVLKFNEPYGVLYGLGFFVVSHIAKIWLDQRRYRTVSRAGEG